MHADVGTGHRRRGLHRPSTASRRTDAAQGVLGAFESDDDEGEQEPARPRRRSASSTSRASASSAARNMTVRRELGNRHRCRALHRSPTPSTRSRTQVCERP
jgi:hypothetical protein